MKLVRNERIKGDSLFFSSTVQEVLRTLYLYGVDYLLVVRENCEKLLHKDQFVAFLELGRERATLEDVLSAFLVGHLVSRADMENVPPDTNLLIFDGNELSETTFQEYRERRLQETTVVLPEWWDVPLPLMNMRGDEISLNETARKLLPQEPAMLKGKARKILREGIIAIRDKKEEKTLSLLPLTEETFLLEDVSGDFEMAQDLLWWAAAGRALTRRMEENGLVLKRLLPDERPPESAVELIPCSWEGESMGKIAVLLPAEEGTAKPEGKPGKRGPKKRTVAGGFHSPDSFVDGEPKSGGSNEKR